MKRNIFMVTVILFSVTVLVLALGAQADAKELDRMLYGSSSPTTSSWYPAHAKVAELAQRATGKRVTVIYPGGAVPCVQATYDGDTHISGGSEIAVYQIAHGLGKWKGKSLPNRIRFLLFHSFCPHVFAVRENSGIKNVADFKGKKVFNGYPGCSTQILNRAALDALGMPYEEFVGSLSDAVTAFKDRRIDAFAKATNGHKVDASHMDIMTTTRIKFVGFNDDQIKKVQSKYPWVPFKEMPAGWYDAFPKLGAFNTCLSSVPLLCRDDFPEKLAYLVTKSVIENFTEISSVFQGVVDPLKDTPNMLLVDQYLHPGAIRYFRERGIQIPEAAIPPEMK